MARKPDERHRRGPRGCGLVGGSQRPEAALLARAQPRPGESLPLSLHPSSGSGPPCSACTAAGGQLPWGGLGLVVVFHNLERMENPPNFNAQLGRLKAGLEKVEMKKQRGCQHQSLGGGRGPTVQEQAPGGQGGGSRQGVAPLGGDGLFLSLPLPGQQHSEKGELQSLSSCTW